MIFMSNWQSNALGGDSIIRPIKKKINLTSLCLKPSKQYFFGFLLSKL